MGLCWGCDNLGIMGGAEDMWMSEKKMTTNHYEKHKFKDEPVTQMLHVWNSYLHLPQKWPKCRYPL